MKNKLKDLNNYLFEQIERLNDDELTGEALEEQIMKSKAIGDIANQIIASRELSLKAQKFAIEQGITKNFDMSLISAKKEDE